MSVGGGAKMTARETSTMARREPRAIPRMVREGRVEETRKFQTGGRYWVSVIRERTRAWRAKAMSLSWTVGVRLLLRRAYCSRTRGE